MMRSFQLYFEDEGVDVQIQFFYSLVSGTPEFRRLMRKRNPSIARQSPEQPDYTVTADSDGEQALEDARHMLDFIK